MTTPLAPLIVENAPDPGTPEWNSTITASKVPPMVTLPTGEYAGYGYLTAWEQYEELKGRYTPEHTDYMLEIFDLAHKREQPAVEQWVDAQDNPEHWEIHLQETWGNPTLGYSNFATLDARAHNTKTGENRILEVKSPLTGGKQPAWVMQTVAQHLFSGIDNAELIIWPFSDDAPTFNPVDMPQPLIDKVAADIAAFNGLLTADTPPPGGDLEVDEDTYRNLAALKKAADEAKMAYETARKKLTATIEGAAAKRAVFEGERVATLVDGKFSASRVPDEYAHLLEGDDVQKTVTKLDEKKLAALYPYAYAAGIGDPYITLSRKI